MAAKITYEKDAAWETHIMSFLEDLGLVKIIDGPTDFKTGMFDYGFFLPDWVINAIMAGSVAYWLLSVK